MENDPQTTAEDKEQPGQELRNRRQFFNGLGKWSLAIIAAVSSVAGSRTRAQASREDTPKPEPEPQRPAWAVPEDGNPRERMAGYFKARHVDTHRDEMLHTNRPHENSHGNSGIQ
jgi:hypothetical protein